MTPRGILLSDDAPYMKFFIRDSSLESPYQCVICSRRFASWGGALSAHARTHERHQLEAAAAATAIAAPVVEPQSEEQRQKELSALSAIELYRAEKAKRADREASDEQIAAARELFDEAQNERVSAAYKKLRAEKKKKPNGADSNKGAAKSRRSASLTTGKSVYARAQEKTKARKAAS